VFTRIVALVVILICTSIAWAILGGTIFSRTYSSDPALKNKVESSWGSPQAQKPPNATYTYLVTNKTVTKEDGKSVEKLTEVEAYAPIPLESSNVDVALDLQHRQKGLLWYSTYKSAVSGTYVFRNNTVESRRITFIWSFPAEKAMYDDLAMSLDGQPVRFETDKTVITTTATMAPDATATLKVSYRSQGLDRWQYNFGGDVAQVRDFSLRMTTNFLDIDFPENTISPTEKHRAGQGWELNWRYKNLVSGYNIAMDMPAKLQPGPLAGQISFFAPVSLLFFFFVVFIITTLRGIDLHPMNYFFLATAFFAFHLLLAYLVDHVSIHVAFVICSVVSIALVVSYLRLVVGIQFAAREAGIAQFIYLVLFSYAFFFKGFTGLAVAVGAILTLFVVMQATGRINWSERFSRQAPKPTY
jgi:inner membrane protein involved in colicin E2 resistance